MKFIFSFLTIFGFIFSVHAVSAEKFVLNSGKIIEGEIIDSYDKGVRVRLEDGRIIDVEHKYIVGKGKAGRKLPKQVVYKVDEKSDVRQRLKNDLNSAEVNIQKKGSSSSQKSRKLFVSPTKKKKVEIFVTDWCPYCVRLEKFLNKNKIKYRRYNIEKSAYGRKEHAKLGGGGVPKIRIGNAVVQGFKPKAILRALE